VNVNVAEGLFATIAIMLRPSAKLMLPLGMNEEPQRQVLLEKK